MLDRVPSLDPEQHRHVSARRDRPHLGGGRHELHLRVGVGEGPHGRDQVERPPERAAAAVARVHPNGEEGRRDATGLEAGDVHVPIGQLD